MGGGGSKGFSLVQNSAGNLNRIVVDSLISHGEDAVSISPSSCVLAESSRIKSWDMEIIKKMLAINLLPVIYGDVVIDIKQGFSIVSTEELLFYLANRLKVKRVIIGTNVDGVIDYSTNKKYDIISTWISLVSHRHQATGFLMSTGVLSSSEVSDFGGGFGGGGFETPSRESGVSIVTSENFFLPSKTKTRSLSS